MSPTEDGAHRGREEADEQAQTPGERRTSPPTSREADEQFWSLEPGGQMPVTPIHRGFAGESRP